MIEWLYSGVCSNCKRSHAVAVSTDDDVVPNPILGLDCACGTAVAMTRRAQ